MEVFEKKHNMYKRYNCNLFCSDFPYRKAEIKQKCDERKKDKDEAIFEILDEDEWVGKNKISS